MTAKSSDTAYAGGQKKSNPATQLYRAIAALAVFVIASFIMFRLGASHFALTLDEGIYIYGAERLLSGQQLYRDFFLFTGPGTLWFFAGLFRLFGPSFAAAHAILALEIGSISAALFAIVRRMGPVSAGIAATASFLALLMPFSQRLYVNHRWDSCCCLVLAVTFLLYSEQKRTLFLISGLLAGTAALFTPPTLLVGLFLIAYLLIRQKTRKQAAWYAGAVCIPLAIAVSVLASQGALTSMLASFSWAGEHYRDANIVPYGFWAEAPDVVRQLSAIQCLTSEIPALLPLVSVLLITVLRIRCTRLPYPAPVLLIAGLGMVASLYPRWSTDQLLFAAPLFLALIFLIASSFTPPTILRIASAATSTGSFLIVLGALVHLPPTIPVSTQLGELHCTYRDQPNVDFATSVIQPGDSLFVYPYQPIWYSLTGGVNPTRFNFLQPGMMTAGDETAVLQQLTVHPPRWVIWHKLSPQMVLAIWPNSDRSTLQFKTIEQFIRKRYSQVPPPAHRYHYAIALFERKPISIPEPNNP